MSEIMSKLDGDGVLALISIVGGLLCGMVAIAMSFWHKTRKLEIAAALKQDMLNRGISADEIQTVVESGTGMGFCRTALRNRRAVSC
jgi:hypothetical protein